MTKTDAELLPCPHCGKQPTYEVERYDYFENGEIEIFTMIYCENPDCNGGHDSIEAWNTRVTKHAEFLEVLKEYALKRRDYFNSKCMFKKADNWTMFLHNLKKFEAEQKADNENT